MVGVLNLIAKDTSESVSSAGHLVTAYALGIAATILRAPAIPATWLTRFLTPPAVAAHSEATVDPDGPDLRIPKLGLQGA